MCETYNVRCNKAFLVCCAAHLRQVDVRLSWTNKERGAISIKVTGVAFTCATRQLPTVSYFCVCKASAYFLPVYCAWYCHHIGVILCSSDPTEGCMLTQIMRLVEEICCCSLLARTFFTSCNQRRTNGSGMPSWMLWRSFSGAGSRGPA